VTHLLVGDNCDDDEQVADKTDETDRAEHQREQSYRLQQTDTVNETRLIHRQRACFANTLDTPDYNPISRATSKRKITRLYDYFV